MSSLHALPEGILLLPVYQLQSYQLLNCDDHASYLMKHKKDPALYRPDICHQVRRQLPIGRSSNIISLPRAAATGYASSVVLQPQHGFSDKTQHGVQLPSRVVYAGQTTAKYASSSRLFDVCDAWQQPVSDRVQPVSIDLSCLLHN